MGSGGLEGITIGLSGGGRVSSTINRSILDGNVSEKI